MSGFAGRVGTVESMAMSRESTASEIAHVTESASRAAAPYAALPAESRAAFLDRIAECLESVGGTLLATASRESHLPATPRLSGELARTCAQFRMFAELIRSDDWLDVRIVMGDPDRKPVPKPELRRLLIPLGPVAVFGASNFPLAYSVPGGDTASALAAGCPVVAKAHPAHPETSQLAADAILKAAAETGMPEGVFGLVWGGAEAGETLVSDPRIAAVGFTGSLRAGRALYNRAAARPRPIPVYAEMGSVNPVFLLPGALSARSEAIASGYAESVTASAGQFCTNPGVVVGVDGADFDGFVDALASQLKQIPSAAMLTTGITEAYTEGVERRKAQPGVAVACDAGGTGPSLFRVKATEFLENPSLREEVFGPSAIAVACESVPQFHEIAEALEGQLTATIHFEEGDLPAVRSVLPKLTTIAGRIIANGFPTGVEVNAAQTHGGPYPATTDSRTTSVGTAAILRFVRPISYQNFPRSLLPDCLR